MMGVGQPQGIRLNLFGDYVHAAFGHVPYQVGSSLLNKDGWRDVDVRLIVPDEEWAAMGFGVPERNDHHNRKWIALTLAWSSFGRDLTGLPIDFQIQQQSHANATYTGPRSALITASALITSEDWDLLNAAKGKQPPDAPVETPEPPEGKEPR